MKHFNHSDMVNGWFVGGFSPNAFFSEACEVAVKTYKIGQYEKRHLHKIATEITLIHSGRVKMVGKEWGAGDIIVLSPNEVTDFEALEDTVIVVVKVPGATKDKYIA